MGEIADMMINGELCYFCGGYIESPNDGFGFPVYCSEECRNDHAIDDKYPTADELND